MNKNQQIADDIKDSATDIMRWLSLFVDLPESGWEKASDLQDQVNQFLASIHDFEKTFL